MRLTHGHIVAAQRTSSHSWEFTVEVSGTPDITCGESTISYSASERDLNSLQKLKRYIENNPAVKVDVEDGFLALKKLLGN